MRSGGATSVDYVVVFLGEKGGGDGDRALDDGEEFRLEVLAD